MKKLIILLLFTTIVYSQNTTVHFYYGSEKMLGAEMLFHIKSTESSYIGGGFSGALEQNRTVRPIEKDEKWCSIYAVGSLGFLKSFLVKYKGGLAVYTGKHNFNEVLYKPLIGVGVMHSITKDVGVEVGFDTFNQATMGISILF